MELDTDARELQKILPDTTRYVTVHLNNELFYFLGLCIWFCVNFFV